MTPAQKRANANYAMRHPDRVLRNERFQREKRKLRRRLRLALHPPPIGPRAIARAWDVSPHYALKCIRKGCPTRSIASALRWRLKQIEVAGARGLRRALT